VLEAANTGAGRKTYKFTLFDHPVRTAWDRARFKRPVASRYRRIPPAKIPFVRFSGRCFQLHR
jgi:hypothetical protein